MDKSFFVNGLDKIKKEKKMKDIRRKFQRLVIQGNHPELSWGKIEKKYARELYTHEGETVPVCYSFPITIGRVLQALSRLDEGYGFSRYSNCYVGYSTKGITYFSFHEIEWNLIKGSRECTDNDQSDETIRALYNLLKKGK